MTPSRMIELLNIERECVMTAARDSCNRDCAQCVLVQDDQELIEMYSKVIDILTAINGVILNAKEVTFNGPCSLHAN